MPRKKKVRRGRPKGGASSSSRQQDLLNQLRAYHADLASQAAALETEMASIGDAIEAMGSPAPAAAASRAKGRPGRPKGTANRGGARPGPRPAGTSLKDYITKVLGQSPRAMRVKDITSAVVRAGYKSKSKTLPNQVSTMLADMAKSRKIKKMGRGLFAGK